MTRRLPTVADLRALKGKGQRTMLKVFTLDETAAAELMLDPRHRAVAPTLFSMTSKTHL